MELRKAGLLGSAQHTSFHDQPLSLRPEAVRVAWIGKLCDPILWPQGWLSLPTCEGSWEGAREGERDGRSEGASDGIADGRAVGSCAPSHAHISLLQAPSPRLDSAVCHIQPARSQYRRVVLFRA
jgi:hypothetical protein